MLRRKSLLFTSLSHNSENIEDYTDYSSMCFTLESLEDDNTITITNSNYSCYYNINNSNWVSFDASTKEFQLGKNDRISFHGMSDGLFYAITVNSSKRYNALGNIDSLLSGPDSLSYVEKLYTVLADSTMLTFEDSPIVDASNLVLPYRSLLISIYKSMFKNCTNLVKAPKLPSLSLREHCYESMFEGCINLLQAPILPATTLYECCYEKMFKGCSKVNSVICLAKFFESFWIEDIVQCADEWLSGCSNLGTFYKNSETPVDLFYSTRDSECIPTNWSIVDYVDYVIEKVSRLDIVADDVSYYRTNTTIHFTAVAQVKHVNGLVEIITIEGSDISSDFPQNTEDEDRIITIQYTYMGVTASTTIIQYKYEPITYTIDLNNQWRLSTTISNPDPNAYDGVYESYSNHNVNSGVATMYIDIEGCTDFKLYIRSYAESNYDYVMVSQPDQTITGSTSYSNTTLVKAHTRGSQNSGTSISSYLPVEFTGMTTDPHRITIVYRKDGSVNSGTDRGYVLIPKQQSLAQTNIITFTIIGTMYRAEKGMTWEEWVNSEYNIGNRFYINSDNKVNERNTGYDYIYYHDGKNYNGVNKTDIIIEGGYYAPYGGGGGN